MHINISDFQKTYYENVKPLEDGIKKEKKKIYIIISIIVIITSVIIMISQMNIDTYSNMKEITDSYMTIIIFDFFIIIWLVNSFTSKLKNKIFPVLFKSIDSNFVYSSKPKWQIDQFTDSGFYNNKINSCISEDNLYIKTDNQDINIYELEVTHGQGKQEKKVFSGLFAHIVLNKSFKSDVKIIYNKHKDFGIIKSMFANEDKVNLENIEFEENYDVYCTDQIYARRILTLTFMEKLLQATDKINNRIQISFKNNNIYIAISGVKLINDEMLFLKKIDMTMILKTLEDIMGIIEVINFLNLEEQVV